MTKKYCDSDDTDANDLLLGKDRNKLLCTAANKKLLNLANMFSHKHYLDLVDDVGQ